MALANGVGRVWCGQDGLLSTPATSAVIRARGEGFVPFGGFICSASHNPGGPEDDFGIKYNCENGGPAPEKMTDLMVAWTAKITEFKICEKLPDLGLNVPMTYNCGDFKVEVFDCVEDHLAVLKKCFDFEQIKEMVARDDFSMVYDSMSGVQGPYARRIVEQEPGFAPSSCSTMRRAYGPCTPDMESYTMLKSPMATISLICSKSKHFFRTARWSSTQSKTSTAKL